MAVVHTPPNIIERIETIWAVVSLDGTGEGICGAMVAGQWMSMTTANEKLIPVLLRMAGEVSALTGKKLKLIKMTSREDVQDITPEGTGNG